MTRYLVWIPLATIIGLSISLALLLARPQPTVVVMTIVTPPAVRVAPAWCAGWDIRYSSIDLRPYCW